MVEALRHIADYVSKNIRYNEKLGTITQTWKLGALWTLNARQGVCLQFSRLYVALARAAGIPARVAGGFGFLEPGEDVEGDYLHAFVEAYIPGRGWLPIEPQYPGSRVGLVPPHPGHIVLIEGLGETTMLGGEEIQAAFLLYKYQGAVEAKLSYRYTFKPVRGELEQPKPSIEGPARVELLEQARFTLETGTNAPSIVEVTVSAPTGKTWTIQRKTAGKLTITLLPNETGTWTIEALVYPQGMIPGYAEKQFTVEAKKLKLSITVEGTQLLDTIRVTVQTSPPTPGIPVALQVETCTQLANTTITTGPDGKASIELGPALLPCKVYVSASTHPPGYEEAKATLETEIKADRAVYAAAAISVLIILAALLRRR